MNDAERQAAFAKAQKLELRRLIAAEADTADEVVRLLDDARKQLRQILMASPTAFESFQLPQINASIDRAMLEITDALAQRAGEGAAAAHAVGRDIIDNPIGAGDINIRALLPDVDTRQLLGIRTFMTDRLKAATSEAAARVRGSLGLVLVGAKQHSEAITDVEAAMETTRSRALRIVRTEVGRAFSVSAQERKMMASAYLPGLKKQWRRSGKLHSRKRHDAIDGQTRDVEQPFIINGLELMYPRDPAAPASETISCGCLSLPIMNEWNVRQPGRQPFSDEELRLNPFKRDLAGAFAAN